MAVKYKLSVDTGGTFTDLCLLREDTGELLITKVSSTPQDPSVAVISGIKKLTRLAGLEPEGIDLFLHGTTVATNALLEHRGARAALITTRGFRDVLYIGRQNRPHLYDFWALRPEPLIPRHLTFEVTERVLAGGSIALPLVEAEVRQVIHKLKALHIESVAVSLLHAYCNSTHEKRIKAIIKEEYPEVMVTLSSDLLPEFREYERTAAAAINALVQPRVNRYLEHLEQQLAGTGVRGEFFVMQSNGGVITAREAREQSARTVLSGPAGGVLAGVYLARLTGRRNLITADMGGTSMDICLIHSGVPRYTSEGEIGGYPLRLPMVDIHTLGAGGGSIAWIDTGGALRVGPQSAGADPGPACYGLGGDQPTVTDANLVLGRINPRANLGDDRQLDVSLAQKTLNEKIAKPLGLTVEQAAEGIIRVVNAGMVRAMRVVSVQRGYDPREFTLTVFGGAGPLHAVELARELGAPQVLVPRYPGVTSAFGMLAANVRHDFVLTRLAMLGEISPEELNQAFGELEEAGLANLRAEGFSEKNTVLERFIDLRYAGQSYELTLPVPARLGRPDLRVLKSDFHYAHEKAYGYSRKEAPVQLVTLRLVATGKLPAIAPVFARQEAKEPRVISMRQVVFDGQAVQTSVYDRDSLGPGAVISGPAVIEQKDSTVLIWPDSSGRCDKWSNLVIELGRG